MTDDQGAAGAAITRTVELGDRRVTIERISGRKASRAFAELRIIGRAWPAIVNAAGKFRTEYEAANVVTLDRARAELEYGPRVLTDDEDNPRTYPDGHPKAGELIMYPGPLGHMTEEAWQAAGQKLELPRSPSTGELIAAVFPEALDVAEEAAYRLLALLAMPNADVKAFRREGTLPAKLEEVADELLDDAGADELLELAVVAGEVIEDQFVRKAQALGGGRMGNALRLLGIDPEGFRAQTTPEGPQTMPEGPQTTDSADGQNLTPTPESTSSPSTSRPTSSTDSPEPSNGTPTPSSISRSSSSPALAGASSSSESA